MTYIHDDWRGKRWRQLNGEVIDPIDMTPEHLENTIRFIRRINIIGNIMAYSAEEYEFYYEKDIEQDLRNMSPEKYFKEYIEPSPLYRRLIKAYEMKRSKGSDYTDERNSAN